MDLNPSVLQIGRDDLSWLGSARGTSQAQSITLVMSAFTANTHYPNGYFPSGLALAKYTSGGNSGLYGPYTPGASNGSQTLAGFLLTSTPVPRSSSATVVNGALLDSGRVVLAKLPSPNTSTAATPIDATAQGTNPRFVYV